MKKLIGIAVILVIVTFGSYYGMGILTERALKNNITALNQQSKGSLFVDIKQYNRGWFTSTATLDWSLQVPERIEQDDAGKSTVIPAKDYSLAVPMTIIHGPIIYLKNGLRFGFGHAQAQITLSKSLSEQFSELFAKGSIKPSSTVTVFVNYMNKTSLRVDTPSFTLISKTGDGKMQWLGMESEVSISPSLSQIIGNLVIDGIKVQKNDVKADVAKISSDYKVHQSSIGLYLGEANLYLPSILIDKQSQKIFELDQFKLHTKTEIDAGLMGSFLDVSLEKLVNNGQTYGPGRLSIALKNLDAKVVADLNEQVTKIQQGTGQQRQQLMFQLLPELPKLFSKGAIFEIKENFVMSSGVFETDLVVSFPKSESKNPLQLMQDITGDAKLKIPETVVREILFQSAKHKLIKKKNDLSQAISKQMQAQAPDGLVSQGQKTDSEINLTAKAQVEKKITSLIESGLINKQGNDYAIQLKLARGQLTVNDQPFKPSMLEF